MSVTDRCREMTSIGCLFIISKTSKSPEASTSRALRSRRDLDHPNNLNTTTKISNDCSSNGLSSTLPTLIEADDIRLDASRGNEFGNLKARQIVSS